MSDEQLVEREMYFRMAIRVASGDQRESFSKPAVKVLRHRRFVDVPKLTWPLSRVFFELKRNHARVSVVQVHISAEEKLLDDPEASPIRMVRWMGHLIVESGTRVYESSCSFVPRWIL